MGRSRSEAERALARLTLLLADLGLQPKVAKTRIVHLTVGGEGMTSSASTVGWYAPVDKVVREINTFLRNWSGYFRYGTSARSFDRISACAVARLARFLAKRHKRRFGWAGRWCPARHQTDWADQLSGIVVAPTPLLGGGLQPNTAGEGHR